MPIIGLLGTLLYVGCIFHAIKTYGRRLNQLDAADRQWIVEAEQNLA